MTMKKIILALALAILSAPGHAQYNNTFTGALTGTYITTGSYNTYDGWNVGLFNKAGNENTAVGYQSMFGNGGVYRADRNTAVGSQTGANIKDFANDNTMLGYRAGYTLTVGTNNVLIGVNVVTPSSTTSNYMDIAGIIRADLKTSSMTVRGKLYADAYYGDGSHLTGISGGGGPMPDVVYSTGGTMTGNLTMSQAGLAVTSPDHTTYLLHMNGTNGSQIIIDEKGHAPTVSGAGTVLATATKKFGSASLTPDLTVANPVSFPNSSDNTFGTGDWTVEAWVSFSSLPLGPASPMFIAGKTTTGLNGWYLVYNNLGGSNYVVTGAIFDSAGSHTPSIPVTFSLGTWHHIALVKYGATATLYVDGGSSPVSGGLSGNSDLAIPLSIGGDLAPGYGLNGNIDEFRITKGQARWTASFTPPASEYSLGVSTLASISSMGAITGDGTLLSGVLHTESDPQFGQSQPYLAKLNIPNLYTSSQAIVDPDGLSIKTVPGYIWLRDAGGVNSIKMIGNNSDLMLASSNNVSGIEVTETGGTASAMSLWDATGALDIKLSPTGDSWFRNSGNVGIGTNIPSQKLQVNGNILAGGTIESQAGIKLTDGSQGAGKVLTSDAGGNGTWQTETDPVFTASASTLAKTDVTNTFALSQNFTESVTASSYAFNDGQTIIDNLGRVIIGSNTAVGGSNAGIQYSDARTNRGQIRMNQFGNAGGIAGITGFKSRGATTDTLASVNAGDVLVRVTGIGVTGNNTNVPLSGLFSLIVATSGPLATQVPSYWEWNATDFNGISGVVMNTTPDGSLVVKKDVHAVKLYGDGSNITGLPAGIESDPVFTASASTLAKTDAPNTFTSSQTINTDDGLTVITNSNNIALSGSGLHMVGGVSHVTITSTDAVTSLDIAQFQNPYVASEIYAVSPTGSYLFSTSVDSYLKPNGNFGIGTNAPAVKLDVTGNIRASGTIQAQGGFTMGSVDVSSTSAIASDTTLTVTCSGGKKILNGGCQTAPATTVTQFYKSASNAWTCVTSAPTQITATATCVNKD